MQAAILRVKLRHLDSWIDRRRAIAARYASACERLSAIGLPTVPPDSHHAYHQFTIRVAERDSVVRRLGERGIQTMVYYPVPLHLQPVHANLGLSARDFPHAERAAAEVLSLPMFPELEDGEMDRVLQVLEEVTTPVAV